MYVYVAPEGNIRLRSEKRILNNLVKGCSEHVVEASMTDRLIYEDNQVKKYEHSKQYAEDINRYHLQKEVRILEKKNKDLTIIANKTTTKELELEERWLEANEYQRKILLLRKLRNGKTKKSMD